MAENSTARLALLHAYPHTADLVEYLNQQDESAAIASCRPLDDETLTEILEQPEFRWATEITIDIAQENRWNILDALAEDRMADILQSMGSEQQDYILRHLSHRTRTSIYRLMHYPENTAGAMMTTEFIQVPMNWTVAQTLQHIREVESTRETVYATYVVNEHDELQFVVPLRKLVCAEPTTPLSNLWKGEPAITVTAHTDKEEVTKLIRRHDFLAIPVVDDENSILGIVTVDDVIDTLMADAVEDINRFGGTEHIGMPYLQASPWMMIRKRAGWLAILFFGEMLTASAMQFYESQLERAVVLAMFIPLIMSSGGNSGSQATSLLIRGLALGEVQLRDWWKVFLRELPTGIVLGSLLGAIGFVRIELWQHLGLFDYGQYSHLIAFTIWLALVGIVTFGSCVGSMLPFILQRFGLDPASASAPMVATLVDVIGLIIYFSVAKFMLTGTLL